MSISRDAKKAKMRQAEKAAADERARNMELAKPAIRALGRGPVAVVVMPGASEKQKAFLAGVKHSYIPNNVLQLKASRVQRLDSEGTYVEETLEKLSSLQRRAEYSEEASLVVFTGTRFPQPETINRIGRGTPEVIERVTDMIEAGGPYDPRFLFIGKGTPKDMPSKRGFPLGLDRGILDAVNVTYALTEEHGLSTLPPLRHETTLLNPVSYLQERPLD